MGTDVRVKICGVTRPEDAAGAVRAGADAIGINFWSGSKRFVRPDEARAIRAEVPEGILCVGVFVNADRAEILRLVKLLSLDAVQLHGDELPQACDDFPVRVIKALRAREGGDLPAEARRYRTEFILLDAAVPGRYGGTGTAFAWKLARDVAPGRLFLAGGLGPANVAAAVRAVRPWAVDVASGVETSPGIKDAGLVEEFIENAKSA